jgi:hypothetical protein
LSRFFAELPAGDLTFIEEDVTDPARVRSPEHTLAIRFADGNWVWIFALAAEDGRTRLISRNRIATPGAALPVRVLNMLVMEPGSLIMERKMLLGIKQRAEGLARDAGPRRRRSHINQRDRPLSITT